MLGQSGDQAKIAVRASTDDRASIAGLNHATEPTAPFATPDELQHLSLMALSCYLDLRSADIAKAIAADAGPDPWNGGQILPGQFAPVVVRSGRTGRKVIRPMHWGYPAPGQSPETTASGAMRWVAYVRNLESPYWIGNLRHSELRCLIPLTSFSVKAGRGIIRCHLQDLPLFAVAGIWRDLTDMPVFAMLATEPCGAILPVEGGKAPASMPAILHLADHDRWLSGDWKDSQQLIAPYSSKDLMVEEQI